MKEKQSNVGVVILLVLFIAVLNQRNCDSSEKRRDGCGTMSAVMIGGAMTIGCR